MSAQAALDRLHLLGSESRPMAGIAPDALAAEVIAVLDHPGFRALPPDQRGAALFRVLLIYSGSWQAEGRRVIPAAERAFAGLVADAPGNVGALCSGYDCLFFLYWCWGTSLDEQVGFLTNVAAPFAAAIRATAPPRAPDSAAAPKGVGYLAQFVTPGPGNAIAGANRVVLESLAAQRALGPVFLYAWMFHDPETLAWAEKLGIQTRAITANSPGERLATLEAHIRRDRPAVLISDMNASIPTVVYERRAAPVQILYQFGMPHWPLSNLDGVFRVWDFEPARAGYDPGRCLTLTIPYDVTRFALPADPAALAAERARLPAEWGPGVRLIGTYGRLAKVTPALVQAAASAIADHPDIRVVFGGSGDAHPLREAIAATGMANRFAVVEGYVDGHLWGHLLDVFLDTFPTPGGASCLEVIAKGKPVVSLLTPEARNLALDQRIASLRASDAEDYARILSRLLADPAAYRAACEETRALAAALPSVAGYGADLAAAIARIRRLTLGEESRMQRLARGVMGFLRRG